MTLYKWSQTAANNATADTSINWQEGQSPSSVNDSARAMMASVAKHRDDITGAIVTGGASTAYTVSSYEVFDTLARLNGQIIAFTPHVTNGATVTLNVDSLGAKPLRSAPGIELPAGVLVQGSPYIALYNNSDAAFYLHGFFSNPYSIPIGASVEFWGATAPNSSFVIPTGQAISRTTYSALFTIMGTTYGAGDGGTTFNVPNPAGRASVQKENSASLLTSTYFGGDSTTLGATGGSESHTLTTAQLASHSHTNTLNDPGHTHSYNQPVSFQSSGSNIGILGSSASANTGSSTTGVTITNAPAGSGNAHNNVQPTIICNRILRII